MSADLTPMVDLWSRWARERPDEPAVTVSDDTCTWAELTSRTNRLARAFADLGVGFGDVVSIGLHTSLSFVEAMVAALKLGAIPHPLSWRLPARELDQLVDLVDAALVVGYEVPATAARRAVATLPDADGYDDAPLPAVVAPAFKAAASGGSTGRPKVILSGTPAVLACEDGDPVPQFGITTGAAVIFPGPLYHNTALTGTLLGLGIGAHVVLEDRFDAELTLRLIEAHRVRTGILVPTHMQRISRLPAAVRDRYATDSLVTIMHNAAPCPPQLKREWIAWLGAERIIETYTATEQTAVTMCDGVEWLARPGTVGRVVQGEMAVFDDDGRPVEPGTIGAIWMRRAPGTPPTYRYLGADSAERADGWDTVGDLGWMDEDGYVYLADRRTDLIITGGVNVYPAEVENELVSHPDVLDCIVVGVPDDDLGKRVHAIVHPASPALGADELRAFLRDRLSGLKAPRSYEFVDHPLRDDAGKVRRTALADERTAPPPATGDGVRR